MRNKKIAITGAFGYSGKYITEKLFEKGYKVKTLTNSPDKPNPFGKKIEVAPLSFKDQELLEKNLSGVDVLINTYWVRFNHKKFNHNQAVKNTKILFDAAKKAGVTKIIHVSITNPDASSELEYFKGKGILEDYLKVIMPQYAIIRPAVLFGKEDILINNIAWMIRHLPVIGVFGKGDYKIQPIHVEDFADVIIKQIENKENEIINAIGPETFTYKELISAIMINTGIKKRIINTKPVCAYRVAKVISFLKKDVTLTKEEIKGLMQNLLYVETEPTGKVKLTEWIKKNKNTLGKKYASELSRRK
ncbi:MAG: NAD-dependent epimerase/dehydratase family protein [Bacteroidales bacterium]|nr:NAD-dependent epimerase/dehydratase family protein [Bacteroidales bacterium]